LIADRACALAAPCAESLAREKETYRATLRLHRWVIPARALGGRVSRNDGTARQSQAALGAGRGGAGRDPEAAAGQPAGLGVQALRPAHQEGGGVLEAVPPPRHEHAGRNILELTEIYLQFSDRVCSIMTRRSRYLTWLIFPYVFESWCAQSCRAPGTSPSRVRRAPAAFHPGRAAAVWLTVSSR
jgi:hypothetical protein